MRQCRRYLRATQGFSGLVPVQSLSTRLFNGQRYGDGRQNAQYRKARKDLFAYSCTGRLSRARRAHSGRADLSNLPAAQHGHRDERENGDRRES